MHRWRPGAKLALFRSVLGALAVIGTVYLTWLQLHPQTNPIYESFAWAALVVVALVGIGTAFAQPLRYWANGHLEAAQPKVSAALRSLNFAVADAAGVDVKQLGASAWVVRGRGWWPYLYRLGRERVAAEPQPSRIRWKKGKGVIGECLEQERTITRNVAAFDKEIKNTVTNEDQWKALPAERRKDLKWADYVKIRNKYGIVIAVPIRDASQDHRVIGVLTLDAPPGMYTKLCPDHITELVSQSAKIVAEFLT